MCLFYNDYESFSLKLLRFELNLMAMEYRIQTRNKVRKLRIISNDNEHLHRVEIDSLYIDGASVHIDSCSILISLS